jgi:hypothetical protein
VNDDGYADVIIGDAETGVRLYYGSATGLSAQPGWTVTSSSLPFSCELADSVAAGDVNGDGYADVIAGDSCGGAAGGGIAYVFYGNGGSGLRLHPQQKQTNGTTPIGLLGKSDSETSFVLQAEVTPAGPGDLHLQWEVKPLGTPFNGTGLGTSMVQGNGPESFTESVTSLSGLVSGLSEGTFYHWRLRIVSSDPFIPRSPWVSLSGNSLTETKFRTAGCIDRDADGYGALGDASCLSLVPDCSDSSAGAWDTPGETLSLGFTTGTTLAWSPPASGALASALVYDTLRSTVAGDFLSLSTVCIESDNGPDTVATDATVPALGQVFFYLNRAQDACPVGQGSLGTSSSGAPRQGRTCP